MYNVLIIAPGFVKGSRKPIEMMEDAGCVVQELDYGLAGLNDDEDEFCRIVKGKDIIIVTAMDRVTRRIIESADKLKMIAIRSAGFEGTDLNAATDHGVLVTHNPGANRNPVAEMAVGLMLAVSRRIGWMDRGIREGKFHELRIKTVDILNSTLGIIGLGRIGKTVAVRVKGFDMNIIYHDIVDYPDFADEQGIKKVSLDRLLHDSDIITLHVPLDSSTRNMVGEAEIKKMKSGAILINTCRGGVVDERAVYSALTDGHLFGYGTDVFAEEPPNFLELLRLDNVVSTPHIAGVTEGGTMSMAQTTAGKVVQFLRDKSIPENVLNPEVLEKLQ
jgi:D-3-phosphoglycerate dehydrogenase